MAGVQYPALSSINQSFISNPQAFLSKQNLAPAPKVPDSAVQNFETKNTEAENIKAVACNAQQAEPSFLKKLGSGALGYMFFGTILSTHNKTTVPKCVVNIRKLSNSLSKEELATVNEAIFKSLKTTGLDKKGVEIIEANNTNIGGIKKMIQDELPKILSEFVTEPVAEQKAKELLNGTNAYTLLKPNKIILPENNKLALGIFHEIGHTMNKNFGKIGKVLQKTRSASFLFLPILLIGIFRDKKDENEAPKNKFDASLDFVKRHAGKLAFAAMLPAIVEETLASYNGNKLAKQLLSPELAKKVKSTNRYGLITYIALAVTTGVAAYLAKTVRDALVQYDDKKPA